MEVLRRDERLADQLGADHVTVALDQRPVGRVAPADLGDGGHQQGVRQSTDHGEHDNGENRWT
jgi:hypothetical protein